MAFTAKLALLLIHFLSVASYGYSSLRENYARDDELGGRPSLAIKEHSTQLGSSFKSGFEIGFAFSSVSIITIFVSYWVPWTLLNKRKRKRVMMVAPMMTSLMARREKKRKEANIQISMFEASLTRISFAALNKATGSFNRENVIGAGKMGTVYKAAHPHLCFTAVKRLYDAQHLEKQFMSELMILGKFRHKNIVPLLGFCIESKERLLVYEYMPNGNLYNWLHPVKGEAKIPGWHFRVEIAVGTARGLAWLHHDNTLQIVHLNISSSCILLDKYFEPKISNFGRAILLISPSVQGSTADSKMGELGLIKKDVYQFGILLLELITGEDPVNNSKFYRNLEETSVRNHGLSTVSSCLYAAVDKSLIGQGFDCQVLNFLKVASTCIQPIPDRRPTMVEVYKMLMAIRNTNGTPEYRS